MIAYTNNRRSTKYERFFWRIVMLIIVGDLLIGLGFIFGLPASSSSYDVARSLMSLDEWGMVALIAASVYLVGMFEHNRWAMLIGLTIGGFYTTLFALTFIFSYIDGTLVGFTGIIWWLVIGTIHTMAVMALPSTKQIQRLKHDTADIIR